LQENYFLDDGAYGAVKIVIEMVRRRLARSSLARTTFISVLLAALRAAARLPAWAGGGAAAGWELDGADHLCALRAAVRRLAVGGDTRHNGTSTQLSTS
jgi:hypothetical protein